MEITLQQRNDIVLFSGNVPGMAFSVDNLKRTLNLRAATTGDKDKHGVRIQGCRQREGEHWYPHFLVRHVVNN